MSSLKGKLLVASPQMRDPNFARTVVLIVEHEAGGALGLVLNRASGVLLRDVWSEVTDQPCESDERLRIGGPVQGPLMALHVRMNLADKEVISGVYFSSEKDHLLDLVRDNEGPLRVFTGYAGWGDGQLDREVATGDWLVTAASDEAVFNDDDEPWPRAVKRIGNQRLVDSLGIKHVPQEPWWN